MDAEPDLRSQFVGGVRKVLQQHIFGSRDMADDQAPNDRPSHDGTPGPLDFAGAALRPSGYFAVAVGARPSNGRQCRWAEPFQPRRRFFTLAELVDVPMNNPRGGTTTVS